MVTKTPIHILPGELRCPRCFGKDIVPSIAQGVRDWVMRWAGKIPRHCRFCGKRFYILVPEAGEFAGQGPDEKGAID